MGPLAIRRWMTRTNRRLAVVLAVLGLACAVVVHHGLPSAMDGMGGAGGMHGEHATAPAPMCAGTIAGAVAIVGLVATIVRRRRPPRPARAEHAVVLRRAPTGPLPRARAGPLYLRLAVLRR